MRVALFGATGMVGQGVLRECLRDDRVTAVTIVVRTATGRVDPKLTEIVLPDLASIGDVADRLRGFDAGFYTAGPSAAGMSEADYTRATYDLTLTVAEVLAKASPGAIFVYVSGTGTDSGERGRFMWARVKGRTENALLRLPFRAAYMFRPGFIQPLGGIVSRTRWYNWLYAATRPLYPLLRRALPTMVTTTAQMGRAMIGVAERGYPKAVLENADINAVDPQPRSP